MLAHMMIPDKRSLYSILQLLLRKRPHLWAPLYTTRSLAGTDVDFSYGSWQESQHERRRDVFGHHQVQSANVIDLFNNEQRHLIPFPL
jgi:hypothetical protein